MSSQFSASEHLIGYLYQVRYALLVLLQKIKDEPGIELSLEKLDDVALEQDGEAIELSQTKHHINQSTQLTDSSSDLWKTLRIWSTHISANPSRSDDLVFLLITTSIAPENSIPGKLRRDKHRDEDYAFRRLIEVANTSRNQSNESAYKAFLSLSDDQKKVLISKIIIVDNSPSIQDVDDRLLREIKVWSRFPNSLKSRLEGWWFKKAIDHLMGDSITIKGSELQSKIYDLLDELSITVVDLGRLQETDVCSDEIWQQLGEFVARLTSARYTPGSVSKPTAAPIILDALRACSREFQAASVFDIAHRMADGGV